MVIVDINLICERLRRFEEFSLPEKEIVISQIHTAMDRLSALQAENSKLQAMFDSYAGLEKSYYDLQAENAELHKMLEPMNKKVAA